MPGPLVAGIAGSVGSALVQSNAAKKAGKTQAATADAQIAESRRQFDLIQGLLQPYVTAGVGALQGQLDLMGLGGGGGTAPTIEQVAGGFGSAGQRFRVNGQEFASREAAQAYADANKTGGVSAQDAQRNAISGIANGEQFGALVKQGEYGLLANQAATGGLRGGDTQAALAQFRPQMLQALIDKQLANLGGLAANGQNAAGQTGTAAQNTAGQVNQALGDRGAAMAGTALAQGQAWQNAGSGIINTMATMAQPLQPGGGAWQKWAF